MRNKTKAELREEQRQRRQAVTSATLAGQHHRGQITRRYAGQSRKTG